MIFEYMILILIACLILHTLNDLLFIICYKFVIILLLYVILFDTFNTKITGFVFRFFVIGTLWKVSKYGVFSWSVFLRSDIITLVFFYS